MSEWKEAEVKKNLDGIGKYKVVGPDSLYHGKSYSDYASDWFNWLLSAKADSRNSGPVVFLTSKKIPDLTTELGRNFFNLEKLSEGTTTGITSSSMSDGDAPPTLYVNEPHIRIGSNRLQIFEDQAVFVPVGVCYGFASAPYIDWGHMQDEIGLMIDNGDNPPDNIQLTINGEPIVSDLKEFRIRTPIFTVIVPEVPYGTSLKDFLEDSPITPGSHQAMVDGYFVMLELKAGRYWVHSWFGAGREVRGPYFSELLYQIEVNTRRPKFTHGRLTVTRPAQFEAVAAQLARKMTADGLLTEPEVGRFNSIQRDVNEKLSEKPTVPVSFPTRSPPQKNDTS
jgi:hypothetical protein